MSSRFDEVVERMVGLPYTEETYKVMVELAEEMRLVMGWEVHTHEGAALIADAIRPDVLESLRQGRKVAI